MDDVTITLPRNYAEALHDFVSNNLVGKGVDGANAVIGIIEAISKALEE